MNVLLVGGPRDGERLVVDDNMTVLRIPEIQEANTLHTEKELNVPTDVRWYEYRISDAYLHDDCVHAVFSCLSPGTNTWMVLFNGYKGEQ